MTDDRELLTHWVESVRMRDPFLLEHEPGKFALYGTTDENLWGGPATGFDYYLSENLTDWTGPFLAFRPPAGFWSDTQYWAPEVHEYQGRWFMLATFGSSNTERRMRGTAVLVADSPFGPFEPWSNGPVTPHELPCLDGTLFVDDDGQPWIVYSRGAEGWYGQPGTADSEMFARRLSADLREGIGEPIELFRSSSASWSKPLWFPDGVEPPEQLGLATDPLFTDGAFLVRAPGGALHMLWSAFGEAGYAMGVATSASGNILGPWTQTERPLWERNGGHGMIIRTSAGPTYLTLHYPNDTPNERLALLEVTITDSGITRASNEVKQGVRPHYAARPLDFPQYGWP